MFQQSSADISGQRRTVHCVWERIVDLYDQVLRVAPSSIVAPNRALALAELRGLDAGRRALAALRDDERLSDYPFFCGALADIDRRAGNPAEARPLYERAVGLSRGRAEREAYQRRLDRLDD
jgi:RNA polymerase sigma-70 factor (ECF subfamily)